MTNLLLISAATRAVASKNEPGCFESRIPKEYLHMLHLYEKKQPLTARIKLFMKKFTGRRLSHA